MIDEVRIDQPGTDNDEYFELAGDPGASLDGLTYLVIGDGSGGSGVIEAVIDLTSETVDTDGFFVVAESSFNLGVADLVTDLNFENSDNVTHLLVRDFAGTNGQDLDTNDDGVLDVAPWSTIVDSVALIETVGSGDLVYSSTQVGPDESYVPGHVFLCADGWRIGAFDGGQDTPGAENACTAPEVTDSILDIQFTADPGGASPKDGDFVVTTGVVTAVEDGGDAVWIQDGDGPWSGLFLFRPSSAPPVGTEVVVSGTVSEFYGLTEIAYGAVFVVGPADLPEPALLGSTTSVHTRTSLRTATSCCSSRVRSTTASVTSRSSLATTGTSARTCSTSLRSRAPDSSPRSKDRGSPPPEW